MHNIKDSRELQNLTSAHNNPVGISVRPEHEVADHAGSTVLPAFFAAESKVLISLRNMPHIRGRCMKPGLGRYF